LQPALRAILIQRARDLAGVSFDGVETLALTAGASAPESLVEEVIELLREPFAVHVEEVRVAEEAVIFRLPSALAV
jgi:4-hydroxy-3-methylbut-2-enyl diphosphate reductase